MNTLTRLLGAATLSLVVCTASIAAESAPVPEVKTSTDATPAALNPSYTLRAGDMLHITVWKEEELDRETLVLPDGTVDFPLIGSFMAQGLTPTEVRTLIAKKLKPFIPAAAVTVVVMEAKGNTISVIGQVTKPGDYIMSNSTTVMQALSLAGGPTPYADDDDIVILRKVDGKETSIKFDYSDVSRGRDLETNITLQPGDVVVVPTASLF